VLGLVGVGGAVLLGGLLYVGLVARHAEQEFLLGPRVEWLGVIGNSAVRGVVWQVGTGRAAADSFAYYGGSRDRFDIEPVFPLRHDGARLRLRLRITNRSQRFALVPPADAAPLAAKPMHVLIDGAMVGIPPSDRHLSWGARGLKPGESTELEYAVLIGDVPRPLLIYPFGAPMLSITRALAERCFDLPPNDCVRIDFPPTADGGPRFARWEDVPPSASSSTSSAEAQ